MSTKKITTHLLKQLRLLMKNKAYVSQPVNAYIIPSEDAHLSEYLATCDERRAYISGFTGSLGTAVVTETAAALWVDGRYYIQAAEELDFNWTLMKLGLPNTKTKAKWLKDHLEKGDLVGVDPYLVSDEGWNEIYRELQDVGLTLVAIEKNLIDAVWTDRPLRPSQPVEYLENEYTGRSSADKIEDIREKLKQESACAVIFTALDDVAYLFNLRGSDIPYNSVFFSYAIVTLNDVLLFINEEQLTAKAKEVLASISVKVFPYEDIAKCIEQLVAGESGRVWIPAKASYALSETVPKQRRIQKPSPISFMKAVKNETEKTGMRNCHVRDGAALCRFLAWLEKEAPKGSQTEISAADVLQSFREEQDNFIRLSFPSISSVGPNASIVHYHPSPETDRKITTEEIYLIDSGGHYRDGTTDVTRTVHFGYPSDFEKECFTRVLKGVIGVATCKFPAKVTGNYLDTLARKALWDVGLDYAHGTGHGIGMYLNVHEGPMGISWRPLRDDPGLQEGMFLSDEPGYYEDNKFGIRIENIVEIVKAETKYSLPSKSFLTFSTITLAPIQTKLIEPSFLNEKETEWLNQYHGEVLDKVGCLLLSQGHKEAYDWLVKETQPIG